MSDVAVSFLRAGYCTHPARVALPGSSWSPITFPATVAVIEHPRHGVILFDTGYSERFFWATRNLPERAYRLITPVFLDEGVTAKHQLRRVGIAPEDVRTIVLSHFHADHLAGAADFPRARYVYHGLAWEAVRDLGRIAGLKRAFLPSLLPADFLDRSMPIANFRTSVDLNPFEGGHDLFDDGTVRLVPMPGHAFGHLGLFVRTASQDFMLSGDACYVRENFIENHPSSVVTKMIFDDFDEYRATLGRLHQFHRARPEVKIVPCHCQRTLEELPAFRTARA